MVGAGNQRQGWVRKSRDKEYRVYCLLVWAALSISDPIEVRDHFDLLELNHYFNDNGQPTFVQLIFWDWNPTVGRYVSQGYLVLDGAIVKTEAGRKKWDAAVEDFLKDKTIKFRSEARSRLKYHGEYVKHPAHPRRIWSHRKWRSRYNKHGIYREITSKIFRETWTGYDPEVLDRKRHPHFIRRGLSAP